MQDFKLLSICIPTYNGEKHLKTAIDSIIKQIIEFNLLNIEVIVSDNCSTENTPKIIQEFANKYPEFIRYNRNTSNIGYDGNVMKLCDMASGKYIHILGDDDLYSPTGLKRLYDILNTKDNLSTIVLSNFFLREDFYNQLCSRKYLNSRFYTKDRYYENKADKFILDVEDRSWPASNIVFRKDYYKEIPDINLFLRKDWFHIYILLYIAKKYPYTYLFADKYPIIIDRVGVQRWLNNVDGPRIYFNNLWTFSFVKKLGYSNKVWLWYSKKLLYEYCKNICYRRSDSYFTNLKYLSKYYKYYCKYPLFWFVFVPKFLDTLQTIFSLRYKRIDDDKCKLITFFGKSHVIKTIKDFYKKEVIKSDLITLTNERGNLKQFVRGKDYIDLIEKYKTAKIKFKRYQEKLERLSRKQYVPYLTYLNDYIFIENIKEKNEYREHKNDDK